MRLTGTTASFTREHVRNWLDGLSEKHDRADWAIVRRDDDEYIGEVVLNDLDADAESMNFRISLVNSAARGLGYGTEATKAVVNFGLDEVGLHRISLDVFDFNPAAQRVYEKSGFVVEGLQRETQYIDGAWRSSVIMSIISSDPRPE